MGARSRGLPPPGASYAGSPRAGGGSRANGVGWGVSRATQTICPRWQAGHRPPGASGVDLGGWAGGTSGGLPRSCWSKVRQRAIIGPCTCTLRINTTGSPADCHRVKKAYKRGLSEHHCSPLHRDDALEAGHAGVRRPSGPLLLPFPTTWLAHTPAGCGHGGTRKSSTSRRVHTRSVSPAAIAGVRGRHILAEPVPLVGRGCGSGTRRLAWGKQKL